MDFEYLHTCEYEMPGNPCPVDCGEPAVARVWWDEWDESDQMFVCQEHLDLILKYEAQGTAPPAGE